MGADFNILEYADPELGQLTGGEKTNILDLDLEQDEVETKEEKQKKDVKEEEHKSKNMDVASNVADGSAIQQTGSTSNSALTQAAQQQQQPMAPMVQTAQAQQQQQQQLQQQQQQQPQNVGMMPQAHSQAAVVQQQMNQHVQQAAAMGRPMPPGTRLLSPDGAIGVVTSSNSVTVSYPATFPGHAPRAPQQHLQGNFSLAR